jgi:hypothetical protein
MLFHLKDMATGRVGATIGLIIDGLTVRYLTHPNVKAFFGRTEAAPKTTTVAPSQPRWPNGYHSISGVLRALWL